MKALQGWLRWGGQVRFEAANFQYDERVMVVCVGIVGFRDSENED